MTTVNVHDAKTQLSKLIARVEAGEEVVIARAGRPVVKLVRFGEAKPERRPDALKGLGSVDAAFFEPLPEEELRLWEGEREGSIGLREPMAGERHD